MKSMKSFSFSKGDKVKHFKYGFGVVQGLLSAGTVDVKFATKFQYVQASSLVNLDSERKRAEAEQARLKREKDDEDNYHEIRRKKLEKRILIQAKKKVMFESIDKLLTSDFLLVDEYYSENCKGVISQEEFDNRKGKFVKLWLAENLPSSNDSAKTPELDEHQAIAVATVVGNVQVIARAGSGKTTTLVLRTFFLIKHCGVQPKKILLLAFNKKAAIEVKTRLLLLLEKEANNRLVSTIKDYQSNTATFFNNKEDLKTRAVEKVIQVLNVSLPYVMTFHALAYAIVHPSEAPLHDSEQNQSLSRHTQQIIDNYLRDDQQYNSIKKLMMAHFKEDWAKIISGGFHHNKEEFLLYRRSLPQQSLKGEYVKSSSEKLIADFLFEHDVDYKYERNHYWSGVNYRPTFTLFLSERSGLIIECFGLAGEPDYDDMSDQKKDYWKKKTNWDLLSYTTTDTSYNCADAFKERLKIDMEEKEITCRKLSDEEIWLRCKDRAIDRFTQAMVSFIGRCRKLSLSYEDLVKQCQDYLTDTSVEQKFLDFACKFYHDYLDALADTGKDDFDGLIQKAVAEISLGKTIFESKTQTGNLSNIKYISIDEYQDFSLLFNNLIQSIIAKTNNVNLFCVGDDWQAINGFAGSDLIYFKNIRDYVESPRTLYIPTNYRSPEGIVSIGNTLMKGLGNPAISHQKEDCDVKLVDLNLFTPTSIEQERHSGDIITPVVLRLVNESLSRNQDVVLLCRKNSISGYVYEGASTVNLLREKGIARYLQFIRSFFPEWQKEKITISTAHKYKGLEKPTVIVMDLVNRCYPLVHPDWVFTRVFGDNLINITEEERRLLYVALTRTKKDLYIITDSNQSSPFLSQIENDSNVVDINWQHYRPFGVVGQPKTVTVKISDTGGYKIEGGTFEIKELLKAHGYKWQQTSTSWVKNFIKEGFSLESITNETWLENANNVELEIFNELDELVECYVFVQKILYKKNDKYDSYNDPLVFF